MTKKLSNIGRTVAVIMVMVLCLAQVALASDTYTKSGLFSLTAGGGWTSLMTDGTKLRDTKTTDSVYFDVKTIEKTMLTSPSFRLVNSNDESRSNTITCPSVGNTATGDGNIGVINYYYYASLKASPFQSGSDTIKIQFKCR